MPKTILFIEDGPALQETLTTLLKTNNYEVISAFDGEAGIELAKSKNPDLIVLDLILPKKDGFVVLEDIKNDENTKNIDVIVLTNLEDPHDIERALNLGAMTYLVKTNHTPEDILKKINKRFGDKAKLAG